MNGMDGPDHSPHLPPPPTTTNAQQRQQAEEELKRLYNEPGAALLLFRIIELHAAGPAEPDVSIRKAAAVSFKVGKRVVGYCVCRFGHCRAVVCRAR